jgi:hypothetical protein
VAPNSAPGCGRLLESEVHGGRGGVGAYFFLRAHGLRCAGGRCFVS